MFDRAKAYIVSIALLLAATLASGTLLRTVSAPWIGVGAIWSVLILGWAYRHRRTTFFGPVLMNAGVLILGLSVLELYWAREKDAVRYEGHQHPPSVRDDRLGYIMRPNERVSARALLRDTSLFDVTYTTDGLGLRTTSRNHANEPRHCLLFFGGSFMFGAGVNDDETVPYIAAKKTRDRFRTYNFGGGGYGPHQMLAALELGYVQEIIGCDDVPHAFYWGIPDHLRRAAGRASWDPHGPRYVIDDEDGVRYTGHFDDRHPLAQRILNQLRKSHIFSRVYDLQTYKSDIDLYVAIVRAAKARFETDYPNGRFHVLFWDDATGAPVIEALTAAGVEPIQVSQILPHFETEPYTFPYDGHPTPRAHELIAGFVVGLVR